MAKQNIQTRDITALAEETGNIYETIVVLSRRARQVAARTKSELDQKLSYFDDLSLIEPGDDLRVNEDQLKISLEYEKQPKPAAVAMDELQNNQIYYRNAGSEDTSF
jgi:DNA-directed RNA polymerase subunit K/omega